MTKKLEEIFDLPEDNGPVIEPPSGPTNTQVINLEEKLEEFDKIAAALPRVKGLGDISDSELDALAAKAEQAYDDLMDLGMNVEARYSGRLFEVAASMLSNAITAKTAKLDKKLKMIDLQIKKQKLDQEANSADDGVTIQGDGVIITDRNSLLEKLKNMK